MWRRKRCVKPRYSFNNILSADPKKCLVQGCQTGGPQAKSGPPCPVLWPASCQFVLALGLKKLRLLLCHSRLTFFLCSHNATLRTWHLKKINSNNFFSSKTWVCVDSKRIGTISNAFEETFSVFEDLETDFAILSNPFSVSHEQMPQK